MKGGFIKAVAVNLDNLRINSPLGDHRKNPTILGI
jgi:hypothetical protein